MTKMKLYKIDHNYVLRSSMLAERILTIAVLNVERFSEARVIA
jgi:hypothetical protein